MEGLEAILLKNWTPGAFGVWTGVFILLGMWWKGLPNLITAFADRRSKIEERLGAEMDAMSKRWEDRIAQADKSHDDCMKGQESLRERINQMDRTIAEQNATIARLAGLTTTQAQTISELNSQVASMHAQARQTSASVLRVLPENTSPQMRSMKHKLDNM